MVKLNNISNDNPKAFWELINKLKHEDNDDKASNIDPSTCEDYFKNLNNLQSNKADLDKKFLEQLNSLLVSDKKCTVLDNCITPRKITQACSKLKNGKSSGPDSILNEMLKFGLFALLPGLTKLFNNILQSGFYPTAWAKGFILPLYIKRVTPLFPQITGVLQLQVVCPNHLIEYLTQG